MWGGDAELYHVRSYSTEGERMTAAVTTSRHTTHNGITSVFGVDKVTINLDAALLEAASWPRDVAATTWHQLHCRSSRASDSAITFRQ
jgi:hypothetical protein